MQPTGHNWQIRIRDVLADNGAANLRHHANNCQVRSFIRKFHSAHEKPVNELSALLSRRSICCTGRSTNDAVLSEPGPHSGGKAAAYYYTKVYFPGTRRSTAGPLSFRDALLVAKISRTDPHTRGTGGFRGG